MDFSCYIPLHILTFQRFFLFMSYNEMENGWELLPLWNVSPSFNFTSNVAINNWEGKKDGCMEKWTCPNNVESKKYKLLSISICRF